MQNQRTAAGAMSAAATTTAAAIRDTQRSSTTDDQKHTAPAEQGALVRLKRAHGAHVPVRETFKKARLPSLRPRRGSGQRRPLLQATPGQRPSSAPFGSPRVACLQVERPKCLLVDQAPALLAAIDLALDNGAHRQVTNAVSRTGSLSISMSASEESSPVATPRCAHLPVILSSACHQSLRLWQSKPISRGCRPRRVRIRLLGLCALT